MAQRIRRVHLLLVAVLLVGAGWIAIRIAGIVFYTPPPDAGPYAVDDPSALLLFVLIPVLLIWLGVIVGQVIFAFAPVTSARLLLLAAGDIVWVFGAAWGLGTVAGSGAGCGRHLRDLCADRSSSWPPQASSRRLGMRARRLPGKPGQEDPGSGDDGGRRMNDLGCGRA